MSYYDLVFLFGIFIFSFYKFYVGIVSRFGVSREEAVLLVRGF